MIGEKEDKDEALLLVLGSLKETLDRLVDTDTPKPSYPHKIFGLADTDQEQVETPLAELVQQDTHQFPPEQIAAWRKEEIRREAWKTTLIQVMNNGREHGMVATDLDEIIADTRKLVDAEESYALS